jgi:hypothetical protein
MNTLDHLFHQGGPLFMGILTILLGVVLTVAIIFLLMILNGRAARMEYFHRRLQYLKAMGLFSMITGIFAQLWGLVMAFGAIERAGDISPQLVWGGLKISMYTTLYGIIIYLISVALWFVLDILHHKKLVS